MAKAKVFFSEQTTSTNELLDLVTPATPPSHTSSETHDTTPSHELFAVKGAIALLRGDKSGVHYFDMAIRLRPYDANLYFEQGLSLLEYGQESQDKAMLLLAARRLKKLTQLDPSHEMGYLARAEALYQLAKLTGDSNFLSQAHRTCLELKDKELTKEAKSELLAALGRLTFELAQKSGEPTDIHKACTYFEKALDTAGTLELTFYESMVAAYLTLHKLSSDLTWLIKGMTQAKLGLTHYPDSDQLYRYLGKGMSAKYQHSHVEEQAEHASCFFLKSLQLAPFDLTLYKEAIRHSLDAFTICNNVGYLNQACNLYEKGVKHLTSARLLLPLYVEAKAKLGLHKEDLNLIKKAQTLIEEAMDETEDESRIVDDSKALGLCHKIQGTYFADCDLLYQGIEYFQIALSADRSRADVWHLMAQTYSEAFHLALDEVDFDTAIKFYNKCLQLGTTPALYFEYGNLLLTCFDTFGEEELLRQASSYLESALKKMSEAKYVHPEWLFAYAKALDLASDFEESEKGLVLSIKLLKDIYALDSNFPSLFHQLALSIHHLGSLILDTKLMDSALHYFKLGHLKDKENGDLLIDWSAALLSGLESLTDPDQITAYEEGAHDKIMKGIALGAMQGYYLLACLYANKRELETAFFYFQKAHQYDTLPSMSELEEESFLEPLMATESMQNFLEQIGWKSEL